MKRSTLIILGLFIVSLVISPNLALAAETADVTEVSAVEIGVSAAEANAATEEETSTEETTGMLIEIGNTTAEETTIIVRVDENGETVDQTVQIASDTDVASDEGSEADLSDWIAGDQITYTAEVGNNSGELKAKRLRNRSFKRWHRGKNGWIKAIDLDANTMDVEWAKQIFTLDMSEARMVAGNVNPAGLSDFEIGDRIRARVQDDGDGNPATWDAKIVVVLRRGNDLFMRVTRWVVPAEITSIPEDTTLPYVITAKVLPSKFYEAGDVNNLIGAPDTEINIEVNEHTRLVRRFLGRATIGEFSEGDYIRVVGRLNEGTGNLDAVVIKNNSIQRLGVSSRISEVISVDVDAKSLVAKPIGIKNPLTGRRFRVNGQEWTVQTDNETKIKKNGEDIALADIEADDIIRVRGTANRLNKTVDADAISVITNRFLNLLEG